MALVTIKVNKETIESGNSELLMCEAKDFLEEVEMEKETSLKAS